MSSTNPVLGMALYSLKNALELYQKRDPKSEERRRFGAIILMDLAVEYILKAKIYQLDTARFLDKKADIGFADVMKDKRIEFEDHEEQYLWEVHRIRNYAQHRVSIPDSLGVKTYLQWLCTFVKRFALDNFGLDINNEIEPKVKRTWVGLIGEMEKLTVSEKFEGKVVEKLTNFKAAKDWIRYREENSKKRMRHEYRHYLLYQVNRFCKHVGLNPDDLVENIKAGRLSADELLSQFLKLYSSPSPTYIVINNFLTFHNIELHIPSPKYKQKIGDKRVITTDEIRKLCDVAEKEDDIQTKSWILANSYMGLKVGEITLLKVKDFHPERWNEEKLKQVYPVKIRKEVSGQDDYTTFIGLDAMKVLKKYFEDEGFGPNSNPWGVSAARVLNSKFWNYAKQARIYLKRRKTLVPQSLFERLKGILNDSMKYEWACYVLGIRPYYGKEIQNSPLDDELAESYLKALPRLKVYEENF